MKNEFDQPIGQTLETWKSAKTPSKVKIVGSYSILEPLDPFTHAKNLFELLHTNNSSWTYLPYGPFDTYEDFYFWLMGMANSDDTFLYTILDTESERPLGIAGYSKITPKHGVIEVGHLHFSSLLKKTPAATEAMYLMMHNAFENLGYRRYEWKCDSLNQPSRNAALRLGFKFEGLFRQHIIYKNRNRDTAWYSIIECEWADLKSKFQKWLNPNNFDIHGNQILSLREIE